MAKKSLKLEWNVYWEDFNAKKIETYNIFQGGPTGRFKTVFDAKYGDDKETFEKDLNSALMYYFWGKAEYEIVLTSWPPYVTKEEIARCQNELVEREEKWGTSGYRVNVDLDVASKIDIYDQVRLNWNVFLDYVWGKYKEYHATDRVRKNSKT